MHYNEALHPDADNYHPRRFMEKKLGGEGENAARTTKPFGGGSTHCPGRVFAEKQMIGVISAVVMRYDLEVTSPGWEIPLIGEFDTLARQKDIFINFSKRQPVKLEV
jgi:cytochrome P450